MLMANSHEITDLQSVFEITEMGVSAPLKEASAPFICHADANGRDKARR